MKKVDKFQQSTNCGNQNKILSLMKKCDLLKTSFKIFQKLKKNGCHISIKSGKIFQILFNPRNIEVFEYFLCSSLYFGYEKSVQVSTKALTAETKKNPKFNEKM